MQRNDDHHVVLPECFPVDGQPRENSGLSPIKRKRSKKEEIRDTVKRNRNLGFSYVSEKSGKEVEARRKHTVDLPVHHLSATEEA